MLLWKTTNFSLFLKNSRWQSEKCFLFVNLCEFAVRVLCFLMRFEKLVYHDIFRPLQRKSTAFLCCPFKNLHVLQKSAFGKQKIMHRQCNFFEIA